jgi:hypothetical protein
MYPLSDQTLLLVDLARHWARGLPQPPTADEVLDSLLSAIWRGDLRASLPEVEGLDTDPRRRLLEVCVRFPDHPGLIFLEPGQEAPPALVYRLDGSAEVDPRICVVWPAASEACTPATFLAAYDTLSHASSNAFSDLVKPLLDLLAVGRDDFAAYCQSEGFPLPFFWFARNAGPASAKAAADCRRWLRVEVAAGRKRLSRDGYLAEAQALFRGLSERSFLRAWEEETPPAWKRRGRPPTHRRLA